MARKLTLAAALPVAAAGFVLVQVMRAAHRRDLPSFPNQDPSGTFGDPDHPLFRIVALGDSSLTAPGVRELDNVWVRRVARNFAHDRRVELISLGVGGSKATDVIEGQLAAAKRLHADIAVVSVGANDAIRGVPSQTFGDRLGTIVDELLETAGAVVLVGMGDLGSIPRLPPTLRPYLSARSRAFDDVADKVAAERSRVFKVWTRGRMTSAFWEDQDLFAPDHFHASDEGHGVFYEAALPAFEAALEVVSRRV